MASKGSSNSFCNYSEEDCMACNGNVCGNSEDMWRLGLELYDDEQCRGILVTVAMGMA
jgi:hypothetical protein